MVTQILIFVYAFVLAASTLFTALLWYTYRDSLLRHLLLAWTASIFSFVLQGIYRHADFPGFLAYSLNIIVIYFIVQIYAETLKIKLPWKFGWLLSGLGLLSSIGLFLANKPFTISSLPFSVACTVLLLTVVILGLKKPQDTLSKGFAVLLTISAIHYLDYPFIRPNDTYAPLGFSVALALHFSFSIYIPLYIIKKTADRYSQSLETQVALRTRELQEISDKLASTNLALEAKNTELDQAARDNRSLLNVLIHDLGNPFTIIFTFLTLAKPDPSNERLYKSWERTLQAKKIILQIIGTVREFQALRLGKLPLKIRYVSLDQMIRDCLFLYEDRLTEKSINVRFLNCEKQQFWVEADDNTLKNQVLANILSNAIKFSPDGGIIDISMLSDADRVKLRIRDHGEGVPENLKTRIFDLDSPTTRLGTMGEKGTGIGLPIVKEYVARMGGQIRLLPLEPNESGACFELEFTGASPSEAS